MLKLLVNVTLWPATGSAAWAVKDANKGSSALAVAVTSSRQRASGDQDSVSRHAAHLPVRAAAAVIGRHPDPHP